MKLNRYDYVEYWYNEGMNLERNGQYVLYDDIKDGYLDWKEYPKEKPEGVDEYLVMLEDDCVVVTLWDGTPDHWNGVVVSWAKIPMP